MPEVVDHGEDHEEYIVCCSGDYRGEPGYDVRAGGEESVEEAEEGGEGEEDFSC